MASDFLGHSQFGACPIGRNYNEGIRDTDVKRRSGAFRSRTILRTSVSRSVPSMSCAWIWCPVSAALLLNKCPLSSSLLVA